jgi:hypothetical protein
MLPRRHAHPHASKINKSISANFGIAGSNTNTVSAAFSGIGDTTLSITPTNAGLNMGDEPTPFVVTNTGTVAAYGFSVDVLLDPALSDVSVTSNTCTAITTLAAGASCTIDFQLTGPEGATGAITASATNADDAGATVQGLSS